MATTQPRCGALTKAGSRCRKLAVKGTSRCAEHQGEWSAYEVAKRRQAAPRKKAAKRKR
jgi:hypothetical protein